MNEVENIWFCGNCAYYGHRTEINIGKQKDCKLCKHKLPIKNISHKIKEIEVESLLSLKNPSFNHSNYLLECPNCNSDFILSSKNSKKRKKCKLCKYLLPTKFISEKKSDHIICKICNQYFFKKLHFLLHMKKMAKEGNDLHKNYKHFECNLCGKKFSEETNIKKHLLSCKKIPISIRNIKKFKCTEKDCTHKKALDGYVRKQDLIQHVQSCHKNIIKPFKCKFCNKGFANKPNLNRHVRRNCKKKN